MQTYQLLTADNVVIDWQGKDGVDASKRCADARQVTIIAWREPRVQLRVGY